MKTKKPHWQSQLCADYDAHLQAELREYRAGFESGTHFDGSLLHRQNIIKAQGVHHTVKIAQYWCGYLAGAQTVSPDCQKLVNQDLNQ